MVEFFVRWNVLWVEALMFPVTYWFYDYPYRKRVSARLDALTLSRSNGIHN